MSSEAVIQTITADANAALQTAEDTQKRLEDFVNQQDQALEEAYQKGRDDAKQDADSWLEQARNNAELENEQPQSSPEKQYVTEKNLGAAESIGRALESDPLDLVSRVTAIKKNREAVFGKEYTEKAEGLTLSDVKDEFYGGSEAKMVETGSQPSSGRPKGLSIDKFKVDAASEPTEVTGDNAWVEFTPVDAYSYTDEEGKLVEEFPEIVGRETSLGSIGVPSVVTGSSEENTPKPIPFATINAGAKVVGARALDGIVGRVPLGNGDIENPYRFSIKVGPKVLATNGLMINGLAGMEFYGVAAGNFADSCVTGYIDGMTYTFEDGTIHTLNTETAGNVGFKDPFLGRLADEEGNECIHGFVKGDIEKVVGLKSVLGASKGAAAAFADGETEKFTSLESGLKSSVVNGDTLSYVGAKAFEEGLESTTEVVDQLLPSPTVSVWVPNNTKVSLKITRQLNIDYDPTARKTNYEYSYDESNSTHFIDLD
ncbi:hypothetical protein [Vibrio tubiashii]|uniref:hypothetical protein n=1 Tax=Vibrio tubiashii TaxID=29498 RepID=UPI001EFD075C|nr:hypothetical protein [Vibrio tubiashii]